MMPTYDCLQGIRQVAANVELATLMSTSEGMALGNLWGGRGSRISVNRA